MELGFIGLGRMGINMVTRLVFSGHKVYVYNRSPEKTKAAVDIGANASSSLAELVKALIPPRIIWVMVTAGRPVDEVLDSLLPYLSANDIVIDGGNSNYKDSIRRAEKFRAKNICFLDAGTSGGIWGLKIGYCIMVGGDASAVKKIEPILSSLAPKDGFLHVGPSGAGHFVKMIHNGIEYGMLEAYAEGFEILHASKFNLDLQKISHLWNQGSVVRSWLLELAEIAFKKAPSLEGIRGYVEDSGEGRWSVDTAVELSVPAPVIALSLFSRFRSRQEDSFEAKFIAALRNEFGGHEIKK